MPQIERTIAVPGNQHDVWDYLSDFTNTEDWDPPTVSTVRISGNGGIGTQYRNVSRFLGRTTEVLYTVVGHEPPQRLEVAGRAGAIQLHDTLELEQEGGSVLVHYRAEFHPRGVARLAIPFLPPSLKILGDSAAKQMERCLRKRA